MDKDKEIEKLIKMREQGIISVEDFKKHLDEYTLTYDKVMKMSCSDYEKLKGEYPFLYEFLTEYDPFNKKIMDDGSIETKFENKNQ